MVWTGLAAMEAPLEPGESRPIMPVTAYLTEDDWKEAWKVVRLIREYHVDVFNLFPEATLVTAIISALDDLEEAPSVAELASALREDADRAGPWLVSTPLANLSLPGPMLSVVDGVVLQRAYSSNDVDDDEYNAEVDAHIEIFRTLRDYLNPPARWLRGGLDGTAPIDTTRTAALLTIESGTRPLALSRGRAKALYAIAVWAILAPPDDGELLPDIGIYGPQPFLHMPQRSKEFEEGQWISQKRATIGSIEHWSPFRVPEGRLLGLPFRALDAVGEKRSAQALLSASLALFQAGRGSRFQLTERLRQVLVAVETLGEPRAGKTMKWKRWRGLSRRFAVHEILQARGYSEDLIDRAEVRLKDARNIATHGADAVLIDLGFPEGAKRALRHGPPARGEDLGFVALSADLTVLIFAVRHVLDNMLRRVDEADWDDAVFDELFKAA